MATKKPKTVTRTIRVKMTDPEHLKKAKELAALVEKADKVDSERKTAQSVARAELKDLKRQIKEVNRDVKLGSEEREMQVIKRVDSKAGTIEFICPDSGTVLDKRKATKAELQEELNFEPKTPTVPKAKGATATEGDANVGKLVHIDTNKRKPKGPAKGKL
jgi:hypothetical protein